MSSHEEYFQYLQQRSHFGHLYRRYWLYPRISRKLSGRVLDVGCGIGDMLEYHGSEAIGVDVNAHTVAYCRSRGLDARVMMPDVLPFEDGSFDSILLDNVLEHIPRPEPLLGEIRRVLKANGVFVAGVPGKRGWLADPDHKVEYDETSLARLGRENGLRADSFFHTPVGRSDYLSRHLRQYCIYAVFRRDG